MISSATERIEIDLRSQANRLNALEAQMLELQRSWEYVTIPPLKAVNEWTNQVEQSSSPANLSSVSLPVSPNWNTSSKSGLTNRFLDSTRQVWIRDCIPHKPMLTVSPCRLPSWDTVASVTQLYLKFCNYQPLPLFSSDNLMTTLTSREPELLCAILALASRFSPNNPASSVADTLPKTESYLNFAVELVMHRVFRGPVELSTIQTLCILSLVHFNSKSPPTLVTPRAHSSSRRKHYLGQYLQFIGNGSLAVCRIVVRALHSYPGRGLR